MFLEFLHLDDLLDDLLIDRSSVVTAISLKVLFLYLFVPSRFEIVYNGKILFFMVHFIVITIEF